MSLRLRDEVGRGEEAVQGERAIPVPPHQKERDIR